MNIENVVLKMI